MFWENFDPKVLLDKLQEFAVAYGLKIVGAILVLIIGRWVAVLIRNVLRRLLSRQKLEPTITSFAINITYFSLLVFVVIASLGSLGIPTASFVAVIGAAGLAVGLALQGSLSNFAAGFLIVIFRPFKVGDFIEAGGAQGVVQEIDIFTTTLKSIDNKSIIVPNAKLTSDQITNYTAEPIRRVDLEVSIGYGDDLDKARAILKDIAKNEPLVLPDPPTQIAVKAMGESSIDWVFRPWVLTGDYWTVYFGLTEKIKKRFDQEGIKIPFPQRDVHIYEHKKD
jgi:small conductance mechanosensitive channel